MKWHYPVGLLFDLYAGIDPATKNSAGNEESHEEDASYPWRLTVHFSDWPVEDLVRLDPNGLVMNDAFINSVKEADFLRNGTAKGIMSLSKEDSSGLWKAVENGESPCKRNKSFHLKLAELTDIREQSISPLFSASQTTSSHHHHNHSATSQSVSSCRYHQTRTPHL